MIEKHLIVQKRSIIKLIGCILCLLLVIACSPKDLKRCGKLRNGEFSYKDASGKGTRIQRMDSVQLVTDEATGDVIKERIAWIAPCTYLLYPYPDSRKDVLESGIFPLRVEVLDITDKYYTVHLLSGDGKIDQSDTAWIFSLKNN